MILKTAYYNSSIDMHSALSTEANFLSHTLNHEFNQPASATIILADSTGSMAQKYDVATNSVYVGSGRAYIEDPDATCVFDGRIIKARHDTANGRVILFALDWMHQLTDERQHYDMREDLDGSGLRQSEVHTDIDGDKQPVEDVGGSYYLNDDDMSWAIDEFNGKYVVFTNEMAGEIKVGTGPYDEVVTASGAPMVTDAPANGEENLWIDDTNCHDLQENADDWYVVYYFRVYVNAGSLYTANSISGARVHIVYEWACSDGIASIGVCNDFAGPGYVEIGELTNAGTSNIQKQTFEVPEQYLASILHTDGTARVKFDADLTGAVASVLKIYRLWFEFDVETSGHASTVSISDTLRGHADGDADYHTLKVGTDLTTANLGIWEGCQYSITKEIYKHIGEMVQPTVNRAKLYDGTFHDETSEAQDTTANDMNLLKITGNPVVNNYYVFGFNRPIDSLTLNIGTAGVGTGVDPWIITWQYYKDGVGFSNLAGVTDGTDSFQNAGIRKVTWTEPTDWVQAAVDGTTTYWISAKVTTFNNISVKPKGTQAWQGVKLYPFSGRSIEVTTGISTKHYTERTKQEIFTDSAKIDKAVFWVTLGGTVFNWKKTFDAAPTEITDASVLAWTGGEYDFAPMRNEFHIYGIRIGDNQLFLNTEDITGGDPGATSKTKYGVTKSDMLASAGTTSEYETAALGSAIVAKDMLVHLYLQAVISGLSALRLGSEVNINSTLLGLTDQKYVITHWSYSSESHRTTVRLHPRSSIGYISHIMFGEHIRQLADKTKETDLNTYPANLTTQTWTQ